MLTKRETDDICQRLEWGEDPNVLAQEYALRTERPQWIQLINGAQWYPDSPEPKKIYPDHIATALSRLPRFGGHTLQQYNVADHSVRVAELVPPELRLAALLHDAHEALSGFGDVVRPTKLMFPQIAVLEDRIDVAVAERFGFDGRLFHHPDIRRADNTLLATEKRDLLTPSDVPWGEDLPEPLEYRIKPRSAVDAKLVWLERFAKYTTRKETTT